MYYVRKRTNKCFSFIIISGGLRSKVEVGSSVTITGEEEKKKGGGYNPPEGMQESSVDGIDEFRRQLLFGPRRPNRLVS